MGREDVLYTKEDGVAILTLNRAEKMNAVSFEMHDLIDEALADASNDGAVKALILTGAGRAFCSGTDLGGPIVSATERNLNMSGVRGSTFGRRQSWTFTNFPKPTIAAVNGAAVGMGAEFALQCDLRVAAGTARFGWIFPHRGLVADTGAGTYLLPRIIGLSNALDLVLSGDIIGAEEALRLGLVSKIVEAEELIPAAKQLAERLTRGAPLAIRMSKQLMYGGLERDVATHQAMTAQYLNLCFQTEDHKEGVNAFLQKRQPVWKGR